jgi:transposase
LDAVFWIARTGAPWRDLPPELGNWNSVHKQYRRWTTSGLWDLMLDAFAEGGGNETHESTAFTDLMAEHDADPEVMLADKGYDSDAIRTEIRARGGTPEIPTKRNRHIQHTVNRALYATRNRIERFFNRPKNSRRVATRYDHNASRFLGFTKLPTIKQWIFFVHAT